MGWVTRFRWAFGIIGITNSVIVLAQTCSDNSGNSPYVCVDWGQMADPERGQDFEFDFSDPANPDVQFITGDAGWVVWSQVSSGNASPAALGDVTIDPSPSSSDSY